MRSSRSGAFVVLSVVFALGAGCQRADPCAPSRPPRPGRVQSCCSGTPQNWYWDGHACIASPACQCDATHGQPEWPSESACRDAHASCR